MSNIVIIQGHPDAAGNHLCHALADAYAEGAEAGGYEVKVFDVARIDFPLLRTYEDWHRGAEGTPPGLIDAQAACSAADHIVFIYPLWLGTMPALLKGFIEQLFRPGVAVEYGDGLPKGKFKGKSARVIITMGMPAVVYRWFFFAHSLRSLERNILKFVGISPIRNSIYGMVESVDDAKRDKWFEELRLLGARAR